MADVRTLFQCNITWIEQHTTLSWRCSTTIKLNRHNLFEYFNWHSTKLKKPNTATIFALILLSGDVELNSEPPKHWNKVFSTNLTSAVFIIIIGYGFGYQDDGQYLIYCKYGWYSE
jgi:hypothetical protein